MGRGVDLNPALLANVAACVADGWKVARIHRQLPFGKRGTLNRKVTNIRRGDSGQRKQCGVQRAKLHGQGGAQFRSHARLACLAHRRQRDA